MGKTIYDVAREAGVGVATVSRALNGSGYVSDEALERIEKACVGYARKPVKKRSSSRVKAVGLIMSHDAEYFFSNNIYLNAMTGISAVARDHNFRLMLEMEDPGDRCLSLFRDGMIDGAILMGIKQDSRLIPALLENRYPFVLMGDYLADTAPFCKIDIDDFAMSREAVEHLIMLGHRNIGFIGGSAEFASCQKRAAGYKAALEEAGIPVNERNMVFCNNFTEEKISNLIKKLLYQSGRVTAMLTFNDAIAYYVYKVATEMGVRIPEGLSVVSFDDSDIAKCLSPGLTTVQQPSYEKGYQSALKLLQQMEDPAHAVESLTLESMLIYRGSCSPPPAVSADW